LVQNAPRWENICTPQGLKSGTVSEALSFTATSVSVDYSCCHKSSKVLLGVVLAQVTHPAPQNLASQTWKSTL
jgi:hypothetical protein